ncbi:hypothetical protein [Neorhodopirellula lusitana]|nr:hypothetical protein [Neorhodopirellula lusitana]
MSHAAFASLRTLLVLLVIFGLGSMGGCGSGNNSEVKESGDYTFDEVAAKIQAEEADSDGELSDEL